jgi:hypothetical protein
MLSIVCTVPLKIYCVLETTPRDPWKPPQHGLASEWGERAGRLEEPGVLFTIADGSCGLQIYKTKGVS